MSETFELMELDGFNLVVKPEAEKLREDALESASLIQVVESPSTNQMAFEAQAAILGLIRSVQKVQKQLKQPLNKLRAEIDQKSDDYILKLQEESSRLSVLMGNWHALEMAKRRAAEAKQIEALRENERKREEEVSKAETLDEVAEIREKYQDKANLFVAPPPPPKPSGQLVREMWDIQVRDIWLLARMHPTCVKIEPRILQIRELLDAGMEVAGVEAKKIMAVSARTG
jgi:hypothetical protein